MNKETIAKALNGLSADIWHYVGMDWKAILDDSPEATEKFIKALEAEVPKELEDCLLSVHERVDVLDEGNWDIYDDEQYKLYCEAQLKAVAPFIEAQVKAEKERIYKVLESFGISMLSDDCISIKKHEESK